MLLSTAGLIGAFLISYFLTFSGERIFRGLLIAALITTVVFLIDNQKLILPKSPVVIDRMLGDVYDTDTRKFITSLGDIRTSEIFNMFSGEKEAQSYFKKALFPSKILVSGDKNTIIVSLTHGRVQLEDFDRFKMVKAIPQFSLSRTPADGTAHFLRSFFVAFKTANPEKKEKFYRDAASVQSPWRSFSHRAAPLFFLSVEKLRNRDFEKADALLVQAAEYLRPNDNPDLRGAVLNNLGIVRYLKGQEADGLFKRASETEREQNIFEGEFLPAKAAKGNLKILKELK